MYRNCKLTILQTLYHFPKLYNSIRLIFYIFKPWFEYVKYHFVKPEKMNFFYIVSSGRNSGEYAFKCLESVYNQIYDRKFYKHIYIDDASGDDTDKIIRKWLEKRSDHRVEYISREKRYGGCFNNLYGMFKAPEGSIIVELNGDDWLADNRVLNYLNKVYADEDVWQTYNSSISASGIIWIGYKPFKKKVIKNNAFRNSKKWTSGHLHSFRQPLLTHLKEESFIDPLTGEYWQNADDQALYYSLFELCGKHSKHIYRPLYVFNLREYSDQFMDPDGQIERAERIKSMKGYSPLKTLTANENQRPWKKLEILNISKDRSKF